MLTMFGRLHSNCTMAMKDIHSTTTTVVEFGDGAVVTDHDTGTSHLLTSTTDVLLV